MSSDRTKQICLWMTIYIYIYNSWNIDCDPGFHGVFCKTTIIRQLRRWKIEKYKKVQTKIVGILFMCGCKCMWVCAYACMFYSKVVKLATIVEGDPKAPFLIATTPRCRGGRYSFPGLLYFTLDLYLIMLSVKQGGIKYHFLSLWYDLTWDCTPVSRAIGKHSNR